MPRKPSNSRQLPPPVRSPTISWFPPHMHHAYKRLAAEIAQIDVVLEIRDARLPLASGNPELGRLVKGRKRLILFNKTSLAAVADTAAWKEYFRQTGLHTLFLDAAEGRGVNLIYPIIREIVAPGMETLRRRGIRPPPQRLMVAGIPNVGKSTLINRMVHRKRLKTAPHPGVTRAVDWVMLKKKYLLMDTPGLVLPRLDNPEEAMRLGWIGTIPDRAIGPEKLATALLAQLREKVPRPLAAHYGLGPDLPAGAEELLESIAGRRGLLRRGGAPDTLRGAEQVLVDFRAGRLGRVTLETPP
ncbi:MAG: ribosome biogenesis GTPase YlqF [bacterium]